MVPDALDWVASGLPTTPAAVSVGFDPATQRLVAVGLAHVPDPPLGQPTRTWSWNGSAWQQISLTGAPIAVDVLAVSWDPVTGEFLLFADQPSSTKPASAWSWTAAGWVASATVAQPVLDGAVVTTATALLLVGALDSTGLGPVTRVQVFSWSPEGWSAA